MIHKKLITECIRESNKIEGIIRKPTSQEIVEFERFLSLSVLTIDECNKFVSVYQPNAELRNKVGLNVIIGTHLPPIGGYQVEIELGKLLTKINAEMIVPWSAHVEFETLHPFTDCNGRLGRMIWYWMHDRDLCDVVFLRGFLHEFYYETLQHSRSQ